MLTLFFRENSDSRDLNQLKKFPTAIKWKIDDLEKLWYEPILNHHQFQFVFYFQYVVSVVGWRRKLMKSKTPIQVQAITVLKQVQVVQVAKEILYLSDKIQRFIQMNNYLPR